MMNVHTYTSLPMSSPMRNQAMKAQQSYEHDLDKLWNILKNATPEKAESIMQQLDEKTITALRTKKNPFKKPVFKNTANRGQRLLAFNVINLTEKYQQRFAMTSLIGFIYRMLDEYEPEEAKQFPSENDAEFGSLHVARLAELKKTKLIEIYSDRIREINESIAQLRGEPDRTADLRSLTKESFIVRAKLLKYELQLAKTEKTDLKEKLTLKQAEAKAFDKSVEILENSIPDVRAAMESKAAYDKDVDAYKAENPNNSITTKIREDLAKKHGMSLEDAESKNRKYYLAEISRKEHAIEVDKQKSVQTREEIAVAEVRMSELTANIAQHREKLDALKQDYSKKFRATDGKSERTRTPVARSGPGGKATRKNAGGSSDHLLDRVEPEKYEPTDDDIDAINAAIKTELGIERTREEHTEFLQDIIQEFLDTYFVYNPDIHVQCAYKPNYEDPLRTPLQVDEHRRIIEEEYERSLVPPDDTFYRWNRYLENHYEELRQATDDIYAEKSDFEFDITPLEIFEGPNAVEEAEAFNRKHSDEVEADILRATFGVHNLMGSWAQNREKRDFYNENSEIIKRILDENEESQKFGRKINKQRAEKKKAENIAQAGPHAKGFSDYKNSNPSALRDHGATEASDIPIENIIPRDDGKLGPDEVEVGVTEIRPVRRRGGRRGYRGGGEQWKFHIPEEQLKADNVKVGRPSAMHKKLSAQERAAEDAALGDAV